MLTTRPPWSARAVAVSLTLMVIASLVGLLTDVGTLIAGCLAWFSALLLIPRLSRRQRPVVAVLILIGAVGMAWGAINGHPMEWRLALTANQALISMLAAVSFLRLVATPPASSKPGLTGRAGIWQTMVGVHLFGAVINIPAMDVVGDRFLKHAQLDRPHLLLLSRGYSGAAFWSPFWGAAAAVLTYAPDASVTTFMMIGGCLAAIGLAISGGTVIRAFGPAVNTFHGHPLSLRGLVVPVTMVVVVLGIHFVNKGLPIVAIITLCAPALTLLVLSVQSVNRLPARLAEHALRHLPAMGGELLLFLSAGVLIAGFIPLADTLGITAPFEVFRWWHAWILVGVMALLSAFGLHPIVSIALSASVLAPLDPNPTLFAMAGLIAWGIQASAGPVSGLNIVMHGRYGIDSFTIARWNAPYVGILFLLACPALWLCDIITA